MTIKPGGYDDPVAGAGAAATPPSPSTPVPSISPPSSWSPPATMPNARCGRTSACTPKKGPTWGQMGRSFIRAALNSARNVRPQDNSPQASAARRIQGLPRTGWHPNSSPAWTSEGRQGSGSQRRGPGSRSNPITPTTPSSTMGVPPKTTGGGKTSGAPATAAHPRRITAIPPRHPTRDGKPSWAQWGGEDEMLGLQTTGRGFGAADGRHGVGNPGAMPSTGCSARALSERVSRALYGNWLRVRKVARYQTEVAMIDPSDVELAAMRSASRPSARRRARSVSFKPLGDYSETEALRSSTPSSPAGRTRWSRTTR